MGHSKCSSKREVYSNTDLPQETGKISNKQPNFIPKVTRKRTKSRGSRRKKIIKIRVKISEIEAKETIENISETKSWFFEKINKFYKPLTKHIKKKERAQKNQK